MRIRVTKTVDRPSLIVVRDDGVSLSLREPTRKFSPPHDLIHYVVEKSLALHGGFWGSIAGGAKFSGMEVVDGRQRPKANQRSAALLKANARSLSEAEAVVGVFQTVLHGAVANPHAQLGDLLARSGAALDAAAVQRTWQELVAFRERWEGLAVGATIELDWPARGSRKARSRV